MRARLVWIKTLGMEINLLIVPHSQMLPAIFLNRALPGFVKISGIPTLVNSIESACKKTKRGFWPQGNLFENMILN